MESVLRAAVLYLLLLVIFRLTGKRSLTQITVFDFVLLLKGTSKTLERMEQIKYAVLEREGDISIVAADSVRDELATSHETQSPE